MSSKPGSFVVWFYCLVKLFEPPGLSLQICLMGVIRIMNSVIFWLLLDT